MKNIFKYLLRCCCFKLYFTHFALQSICCLEEKYSILPLSAYFFAHHSFLWLHSIHLIILFQQFLMGGIILLYLFWFILYQSKLIQFLVARFLLCPSFRPFLLCCCTQPKSFLIVLCMRHFPSLNFPVHSWLQQVHLLHGKYFPLVSPFMIQ